MDWLVLQLTDSAFPSGGFAHSAGLEAAHAWGDVTCARDVERFARDVVWQAGAGALPFVRAAAEGRFDEADRACDAFLVGTVSNRASRTQGRALTATAGRVFDANEAAVALARVASEREAFAHLAPVFGAVTAALGVAARAAQEMFLYTTLRQTLSAAVRLGLVGPHEAQSIQHASREVLDDVLTACASRGLGNASQTAPLLELTANLHDGLYARLFQS